MAFIETKRELGWIKSGREYEVKFPYKDIISIDKAEASCDCVSLSVEKEFNRLVVKYKPKPVPIHLQKEGKTFYETQKSITVTFKTKDYPETPQLVVLLFEAKVQDQ